MTLDVDAVVIGAGPAGMACSEVLARHNANVVVLDEQNAPGGQIYKNIEGVRIIGISTVASSISTSMVATNSGITTFITFSDPTLSRKFKLNDTKDAIITPNIKTPKIVRYLLLGLICIINIFLITQQ